MRVRRTGTPALQVNLSSLLAEHSLSLTELAAQTGISLSYLSRITRGQITNPTIDIVSRLAQAFDITVSQLLGEESTLLDELPSLSTISS